MRSCSNFDDVSAMDEKPGRRPQPYVICVQAATSGACGPCARPICRLGFNPSRLGPAEPWMPMGGSRMTPAGFTHRRGGMEFFGPAGRQPAVILVWFITGAARTSPLAARQADAVCRRRWHDHSHSDARNEVPRPSEVTAGMPLAVEFRRSINFASCRLWFGVAGGAGCLQHIYIEFAVG